MSTTKVIVLRGLPGSGKTYMADILQNKGREQGITCSHHSADHYWEDVHDGEFVAEDLHLSHARCLRSFANRVLEAAANPGQLDMIIVDNTHLRWINAAPYVRLAEAYCLNPLVIDVWCNAPLAFDRQKHGVPEGKFRKMLRDYKTEPQDNPFGCEQLDINWRQAGRRALELIRKMVASVQSQEG